MIIKKNYKITIPVSFFIIFLGLLTLYVLTDHQIFQKQQKMLSLINMEKELNKSEDFLYKNLKNSERLIYSVNSNPLFKNYLQNKPDSKKNLEYLFESLISSDNSIMQIRFIDHKGMEQIRYERYAYDDPNYHKIEKLQNKSDRYYFKQKKYIQNTLFYSPLDLNIENKKLQIPFKPTYRIVLPVNHENTFKGILVVNYFAQPLFRQLFHNQYYNFILLDKEGYIIQHYNKNYNWSRYKKEPFKAEEKYLTLLDKKFYRNEALVSKHLELPFSNKLTLVCEFPNHISKEEHIIYKKRTLTNLSLFAGLIFILSFILYLILKRMEKQQAYITDLNRKKLQQEKLLIQNSKMAAMGEMIANIAHQWRQPLSIISLHLANLQIKTVKNKVTNEFLEQFINKITKNIDTMNHTIEDFSNFFKPNRPKEKFDINTLIKECLKIVEKPLKDADISVTFNSNSTLLFTGYRNNLLQVLINIIINSKDAIVMNNIKNGRILIKSRQKDNSFIINISDNGGGIAENILNRVFEPYFTTKFKSKGTGIGLYMCKTIIEDSLYGSIKLTNIDKGILCTIKLKNME